MRPVEDGLSLTVPDSVWNWEDCEWMGLVQKAQLAAGPAPGGGSLEGVPHYPCEPLCEVLRLILRVLLWYRI